MACITMKLQCVCLQSFSSGSQFTITFTYQASQANAWVGLYPASTSTPSNFIVMQAIGPINGTGISTANTTQVLLGSSYYCYMCSGTSPNCSPQLTTPISTQCRDPFLPPAPPPGSPPPQLSGGTPLGIGLACALVLGFIIIGIVIFLVIRKKKQQDEA